MKLTWKELVEELKRQGYIHIMWHKDDIISILEQKDIKYTEEDLDSIVEYVENAFDAQVGISWEVLELYIDQWKREKDNNSKDNTHE